jgi:uncharacterized damage-inducible protein DinB
MKACDDLLKEIPMKTYALWLTIPLAAGLLQAQSSTASSPKSADAATAAPMADPLSTGAKMMYGLTKTDLAKAAEMMPEADYAFKPTPAVRSFGQIVGHVADAQYLFCSAASGEEAPKLDVEKTKTKKADLVAALNDAFAYCDKVYNSMTDAHAADLVKFFGRDFAKVSVLSFNAAHNFEHYGNIVTYMRLKGLVPPSSAGK